jgi:hypothetical protein
VSTTEELLGRNSSGYGLENREYGRGDPLRWPRDNFYPQKLTLTSPTSGGRSVGIVRLWIEATEFVCATINNSHSRDNGFDFVCSSFQLKNVYLNIKLTFAGLG